jgi:hypothetical protein
MLQTVANAMSDGATVEYTDSVFRSIWTNSASTTF